MTFFFGVLQKSCAQCSAAFEITESDLQFYDRVSPIFHGKKYPLPPPRFCPDCRQQRRMAWRGKEYFFRTCDLTGKRILSSYPPTAKMITHSSEAFYGDSWNGLDAGRDFDFSRSFFEQFFELWFATPKHTSNTTMTENSEYVINAHQCKNCYMADEMDYCRDCYYGYNIQYCEDMVNCFYVRNSKVCYELSQGQNCYEIFFAHNVHHSSHCAFMQHCRKCSNCLFCTNLRNKQYHIFNQPVSPKEFEEAWNFVFFGTQKNLDISRRKFTDFLKKQPVKALISHNSEDCSGDQLFNCKNCYDCFNVDNARDCRYCTDIHYSKDCYDVHIYEGELLYESLHVGPKGYNQLFSHLAWFSSDTFYSSELRNCRHVFGCSALKKAQYCILNKQYSKEEYEKMVGKIIEHMQQTGEWGEFFPISYSPFGYNQTMAAYYFPLTEQEALAQNFTWAKETDKPHTEAVFVPESLAEVNADTPQQAFTSMLSGKNYSITPQEIRFHQQYKIPLPQITPAERVQKFVDQNPRKLWQRQCDKCQKEIQTTYSPDRPEMVYCEECYLTTVY